MTNHAHHVIDRSLHPAFGVRPYVSPSVSLTAALVLAVLGGSIAYIAGFGAYGFLVGAGEYLAAVPETAACDNPASRFGWGYEAINYDQADDARLLSYTPDPSDCGSQGEAAGPRVTSSDGTPIAGWYIPAALEPRPTGPTVVLVHGGKTNKSGMLDYAPALHERYNLVLLDLRNSGRSGGDESTGGVRERHDLRAMLDWLAREKEPTWIAVVGNSNGAATALAEAVDDPRVRALVLDSMHASVERQLANLIVTEHAPAPAFPLAPAIVAGVSARIGEDLASVDPERMLERLPNRPILLTHGTADLVDRPLDSLDVNLAAARGAGINVHVERCEGAGHGQVVVVCRADWQRWVLEFFADHGGLPPRR